jgi:hypothetical protein
MAVTLFMVRATITKEQEAAFNKWYDEEHVPQVLRFNGVISGRRYKRINGDDKYDYMALYEFKSEEAFKEFQTGGYLAELRAEYDKYFGKVSDRAGTGWVQVFP